MSALPETPRVKAHVHVCPLHRKAYTCPKVTSRCLLQVRTVAECPFCAEDQVARVARGKAYWAPLVGITR